MIHFLDTSTHCKFNCCSLGAESGLQRGPMHACLGFVGIFFKSSPDWHAIFSLRVQERLMPSTDEIAAPHNIPAAAMHLVFEDAFADRWPITSLLPSLEVVWSHVHSNNAVTYSALDDSVQSKSRYPHLSLWLASQGIGLVTHLKSRIAALLKHRWH